MGSIGAARNSGGVTNTTYSYDVDDYAVQHGYNSAEEMVQENLTESNEFFTSDQDMIDFAEDLGYTVISNPNGESFVVVDDRDNSDSEFIVEYNRAGSSRYITRVRRGL